MICCYLLYSRQFTKSYDALRYYGMMRTKNKKGVTIPSQLRYIYCFETALNKNWTRDQVPRPEYLITKIRMVTVPQLNFMGGSEPWFMIHYNGVTYNSNDHFKSEKYKNVQQRYFALNPTDNGVQIEQGDSIEALQTIVLLDEELSQSDRYMEQEI